MKPLCLPIEVLSDSTIMRHAAQRRTLTEVNFYAVLELFRIERLSNVIVRAEVVALYDFTIFVFSGNHYYRQLRKLGRLSQLRHEFIAIHARHHYVEQRKIDLF